MQPNPFDGEIEEASNHPYECDCKICLEWWDIVGPEFEDEKNHTSTCKCKECRDKEMRCSICGSKFGKLDGKTIPCACTRGGLAEAVRQTRGRDVPTPLQVL